MCKDTAKVTPFVKVVNADPDNVTSKLVYDYVAKGDAVAIEVHVTMCEMLARGIGIYCNSFSPDRIILGGGLMMAGKIIIDEVSKHVAKHCWKDIWDRCELVIAECGEDAGVLGAAAMAFEDFDNIHEDNVVSETNTARSSQ
jgi:glucokinase